MSEAIMAYAEKASIIALLLAAVVAFMRGWIVPGPTHDRVVRERDLYLAASTRGMEIAKEASRVATVVLEKKDTP